MCLLTACLPVCCASVQYRACTRAYMLGHAHIAHVRTCAHTPRLLMPVCTCVLACTCLPACRPSEAARVLWSCIVPIPYGACLLCWSFLYAHARTHVCTGNARTYTDALMVTRTHAMHARSCLTRTQAHAHAPVTRPGAKPGTCLSKYNPFQTLDKLSSRWRERRV